MKKFILLLLFICITSFLFSQSFRDENTVDLKISNARTDNGVFKMEIELKRTSEWPFGGTWDNLLWNGDFEFSFNQAGFSGQPQYTNLNSQLNTSDYAVTATAAGNALTLSIIGPTSQLDATYSPALNVWETICTVEWNIADPSQNSGIEWSTTGTGLISAAGFPGGLIINTYYGSGNISLLSAEPSVEEPVLGIMQSAPNPFGSGSSSTHLHIISPAQGHMKLNVFNIKGQLVNTLYNNIVQKNQDIQLSWNGKDSRGNDLSSGIYLYQLLIENKLFETKKVVIIR